MKQYTHASACAGIGGMTMGLNKFGSECVIAWEFDPTEKKRQYAQEAHKLLHPEVRVDNDITNVDMKNIPDFDIYCLTTPCQAFSKNGRRGGFEDTRGTIIFSALEIAKEKQPKMMIMENVLGLLNHDKGNTMKTIVHAMNDIGYNVDFTVINSSHFQAPQKRERVYLIAVRDDLIDHEEWVGNESKLALPKLKRQLLGEGAKTFNFEWPVGSKINISLLDILEEGIDEKYILSKKEYGELIIPMDDIEGIAVRQATKQGYDIAQVGDAVNFQFPKSKTRRGRVGKQMANTIETSVNQGVVLQDEDGNYFIKKFSPREYLRLQAIPEDVIDILIENFNDKHVYKFAGNGLTLSVVEAICEKALNLLTEIDK